MLAAGKGVRAQSQDRNLPKVLLKDNKGQSLLIKNLNNLAACSKDNDIKIVVGFLHEKIIEEIKIHKNKFKYQDIDLLYNQNYKQGVITSLYLGLINSPDDVTIMNGDTYFKKIIFEKIQSIANSSLLVMPKENVKDSIKVATKAENIVRVGKNLNQFSYISTGCLYLQKEHKETIIHHLKNYLLDKQFEKMIWHEIINILIKLGKQVSASLVNSNSAFEIDTLEDHQFFLNSFLA